TLGAILNKGLVQRLVSSPHRVGEDALLDRLGAKRIGIGTERQPFEAGARVARSQQFICLTECDETRIQLSDSCRDTYLVQHRLEGVKNKCRASRCRVDKYRKDKRVLRPTRGLNPEQCISVANRMGNLAPHVAMGEFKGRRSN